MCLFCNFVPSKQRKSDVLALAAVLSHSSEFGTSSTKTHTNMDICNLICENGPYLQKKGPPTFHPTLEVWGSLHSRDMHVCNSAIFQKACHNLKCCELHPVTSWWFSPKSWFLHYCCINASSIKHPHLILRKYVSLESAESGKGPFLQIWSHILLMYSC